LYFRFWIEGNHLSLRIQSKIGNLKSKIKQAVPMVEGDEAISQVAFYGSDVLLREMQTSKKRPVGSNRQNRERQSKKAKDTVLSLRHFEYSQNSKTKIEERS
jgi:hypothetical protein